MTHPVLYGSTRTTTCSLGLANESGAVPDEARAEGDPLELPLLPLRESGCRLKPKASRSPADAGLVEAAPYALCWPLPGLLVCLGGSCVIPVGERRRSEETLRFALLL
jgi:hypothetical protein